MVSFQPHMQMAQGHSHYRKLNNAPHISSLEENMDKYPPRWCSRYVSALDWDGQVETWACRRDGQRNEVEGNGALGGPQAAPRCIPSACVQPKHLMKSESAVRSERFHQNKALSSCFSHTLYPPLFISLLSFPRVIHVRTGVMVPLTTSDPGQVQYVGVIDSQSNPISLSMNLNFRGKDSSV